MERKSCRSFTMVRVQSPRMMLRRWPPYPCLRTQFSELTVDLRFSKTKSYLSLSSEPPPSTGRRCLRHAAPVVQLSYWRCSYLRATHALYLGSTSIACEHPSISAVNTLKSLSAIWDAFSHWPAALPYRHTLTRLPEHRATGL